MATETERENEFAAIVERGAVQLQSFMRKMESETEMRLQALLVEQIEAHVDQHLREHKLLEQIHMNTLLPASGLNSARCASPSPLERDVILQSELEKFSVSALALAEDEIFPQIQAQVNMIVVKQSQELKTLCDELQSEAEAKLHRLDNLIVQRIQEATQPLNSSGFAKALSDRFSLQVKPLEERLEALEARLSISKIVDPAQ